MLLGTLASGTIVRQFRCPTTAFLGYVAERMFFDDWFNIARIVIVGTIAYAVLIIYIRLFGKRTLSKMNAFDLIVTVALGSTLATVIVSKDVRLVEGLAALLLLCGLQFVVAFVSVRWPLAERLVKSEPALLFFGGRFLSDTMRRERVTEDEVLAAVRGQGIADLAQVSAAMLEADGSVTVVKGLPGDRSTLPERAEDLMPVSADRSADR